MRLLELIDDIEGLSLSNIEGRESLEISGLAFEEANVQSNFLFAVFSDKAGDNTGEVESAIKNGATAILAPDEFEVSLSGVAVIHCQDPREVLAEISKKFFGQQVERVAAVTGTNGKTSTVNFCRQIWDGLGFDSASLGTIGLVHKGKASHLSDKLSTPDSILLHSKMAELKKAGVTHVAIEATSEGMDQSRLKALDIKVAGYTNFTRDHIDYHETMEDYFSAKLKLFSELLSEGSVAVLNADIPEFSQIKEVCDKKKVRVVSFGKAGKDLRLLDYQPIANGQAVKLNIFGCEYSVEIPLVGQFQIYNILCALGMVLAEDIGNKEMRDKAVKTIERLTGVDGRLEFAARLKNGATIYIDYAHTPDALESMLKSIRPHAQKKLHVLFGCGGDRDKGKRPMMGKIAANIADNVIVTDDNPRTEDAATIRSEIMCAAKGAMEVGDRRQAIIKAIEVLNAGDILVVAGKGHERGQYVGNEVLPFNDMEEVKKVILGVYGDK